MDERMDRDDSAVDRLVSSRMCLIADDATVQDNRKPMAYDGGTRTECEKPSQGDDNGQETWQTMKVASKAKFVLDHCTVEPVFGCYVVTSVLTGLCTQNLNLQKACRVNLGLSNSTCTALENRGVMLDDHADAEVAVQELMADMIMWKTVVQSSIPLFLIIFMGSWSDRHRRRKPCLILPIVGELITTAGLLACTHYFYELPMEVVGWVESLPPAMTGGCMTMSMAVFSYIGDVSSVESRTLRIGITIVFFSVTVPIGTALSGIMFRELGFYGVYTVAMVLYILTIAYGVIYVKEPKSEMNCNTLHKLHESPSYLYVVKDFFNLDNIKEAILVTFKDGQNNRKMRIILLMIVVIVVMGPLHGEMSMMYMFTRVKFKWNEIDLSMFFTYSMVTNLLGTLFSVAVLSHKLQIDDALIGVMSCMSKILAGFVYAFATTDFIFYIAPLVEIVNGTSFIAMRSIISKLVNSDELGKVNSIFGVCEALVPLIYGPMYSAVYKVTLKKFPGAFFLLGSALTAPAAVIFLWMYYEHKKERKEREIRDKENIIETAQKDHNLDIRLSTCAPDLGT